MPSGMDDILLVIRFCRLLHYFNRSAGSDEMRVYGIRSSRRVYRNSLLKMGLAVR
jgi:hypothetical protein